MMIDLIAVVVAYLLGSVPSAYLVGRLRKGIDIRVEGDGHLGTAAAFRRLGVAEGLLVGLMDVSKGALVIMIAQQLNVSTPVIYLAGVAVVIGHNWPIFLQFCGGLGALVSYGALLQLLFWPFFMGLGVAVVIFLFTRRPGLSTFFLFSSISAVLLAQNNPPATVAFPVFLSFPMFIKRFIIDKKNLAGDNVCRDYQPKSETSSR